MHRFLLGLPVAVLVVVALVLASQPGGLTGVSAAPDALSLELNPTSIALDAERPTRVVELRVRDGSDVSGYEVELTFDPVVVMVERVERVVGTDAQPSARTWASLPLDEANGYLTLDADTIAFGAFSFATGNVRGLDGDVSLARIYVRGRRTGSTALRITHALVASSTAQASQPAVGEAAVSVNLPISQLFFPHIQRSLR